MVDFTFRHLIGLFLVVIAVVVFIIAYATLKERGENPIKELWEPLFGTEYEKSDMFGLVFSFPIKLQYHTEEMWADIDIQSLNEPKTKELFTNLDDAFKSMISKAEDKEIKVNIENYFNFDRNVFYLTDNLNGEKGFGIDLLKNNELVFYSNAWIPDNSPGKEIIKSQLIHAKDSILKDFNIIGETCQLYWDKQVLYFKTSECFNRDWTDKNWVWEEESFGINEDNNLIFLKSGSGWAGVPDSDIFGIDTKAIIKRDILFKLKERKESVKTIVERFSLTAITRFFNIFDNSRRFMGNYFGTAFSGGYAGQKEVIYGIGGDGELYSNYIGKVIQSGTLLNKQTDKQINFYDEFLYKVNNPAPWEQELKNNLLIERDKAVEDYKDNNFEFIGDNKAFFETSEGGNLRIVVLRKEKANMNLDTRKMLFSYPALF